MRSEKYMCLFLAGIANMLNKVRKTREYSIVVYEDGIATEVVI